MGRHPRAGGGGLAGDGTRVGAALLAHGRRYFREVSRSCRRTAVRRARSMGSFLILRDGRVQIVQRVAAAAQPQRPSRRSCCRNFRRICAPTISLLRAVNDLRELPFAAAARTAAALVSQARTIRASICRTDRAICDMGRTGGGARQSGAARVLASMLMRSKA